jgi:hypothetical protein
LELLLHQVWACKLEVYGLNVLGYNHSWWPLEVESLHFLYVLWCNLEQSFGPHHNLPMFIIGITTQ